MKLAVICPTNTWFMPYLRNYLDLLQISTVDYDVIYWDRLHTDETNAGIAFRDSKIGYQRGFFDYLKFRRFVLKSLEKHRYDSAIVLGIQMAFMLRDVLTRRFRNAYILDVRDYNKVIRLFDIKRVVDSSYVTVISSRGYTEWLPKSDKYRVNHNTRVSSLEDVSRVVDLDRSDVVRISCIGVIRDYLANIALIDSLRNERGFELYFHGDGPVCEAIIQYTRDKGIENVFFTGRYRNEDEEKLYRESHLINVVRLNDGVNNRTALPNRLYNAAYYGRPLLCCGGTLLSEVIQQQGLGLVIDSFCDVGKRIVRFFDEFDIERFNNARISFFEQVIAENKVFQESVLELLSRLT